MSDTDEKTESRKSKRLRAYRQQESARVWNQIQLEQATEPLAGDFHVVLSLSAASNHEIKLKPDTPLGEVETALKKTHLLGQFMTPARKYSWMIGNVRSLIDLREAETLNQLENLDEFGHPILKVLMQKSKQVGKKKRPRTTEKGKGDQSPPKKRQKNLDRSL